MCGRSGGETSSAVDSVQLRGVDSVHPEVGKPDNSEAVGPTDSLLEDLEGVRLRTDASESYLEDVPVEEDLMDFLEDGAQPDPQMFSPFSDDPELKRKLEEAQLQADDLHSRLLTQVGQNKSEREFFRLKSSEMETIISKLTAEREVIGKKLSGLTKSKPRKAYLDLLSERQRYDRLKLIQVTVSELLDPSGNNVRENAQPVLRRLFGRFSLPSEHQERLSPFQDLLLSLKCGLTNKGRKKLKKVLIEFGKDNLASTASVDKLRNSILKLYSDMYETRSLPLTQGKSEGVMPAAVWSVKDLQKLLNSYLSTLKTSGKLKNYPECDGKIKLNRMGDKGGQVTKMIVTILNVDKTNSVHSALPLACYVGDESRQNIEAAFGSVYEACEAVTQVTFSDGSVMEVEWMECGDMKFKCTERGHQGPMATFFCLYCKSEKTTANEMVREGMKVDNLRTDDEFSSSAAAFAVSSAGAIPSKKLRLTKDAFNLTQKCLTHTSIENSGPSPLHVNMGNSQNLVTKCENLATRIDCGMLYDTVKQAEKVFEKACEKVKDLSEEKSWLESEKEKVTLLSEARRLLLGQKQGRKAAGALCDAPLCIVYHKKAKLSQLYGKGVIRCKCPSKNRFHPECLGLVSGNHIDEIIRNGPADCSIHSDFLTNLSESQKLVENSIAVVNAELVPAEKERSDLETALKGKRGPVYQKLQEAWKGCGAWKSAWQQTFSGNHYHKILSSQSRERIVKAFEGHSSPELDDLEKLLGIMETIHTLSASKFLSDAEIDLLELKIKSFCELFAARYPDEIVTPKLHWLYRHVIPFTRKHRTWGMVTEQPIESIHKTFNDVFRRFRQFPDPLLRLERTCMELVLRNVVEASVPDL